MIYFMIGFSLVRDVAFTDNYYGRCDGCIIMSPSGGTRAATAATSRNIKQRLVNLLFGGKYRKTVPEECNRNLDYSMYSYNDLRTAYLKRLQVIHPDKIINQSKRDDKTLVEERKNEFQELQDLWDKYDEMAKSMMKVTNGDGAAANFTLFGVGCSFSDNEEEKALRNEITDQACRGWFSSGLLVENSSNNNNAEEGDVVSKKKTSLVDDDMFIEASLSGADTASTHHSVDNPRKSTRRTLIPGLK